VNEQHEPIPIRASHRGGELGWGLCFLALVALDNYDIAWLYKLPAFPNLTISPYFAQYYSCYCSPATCA
jgi:hypothetical protein